MKRTPLKRSKKALKKTPLKRTTPLRPRSKKNSRQPAESLYMKWIRSLPCIVCGGAHGRSEAAHTKVLGSSGIGSKSPNSSTIPLCAWDHRLALKCYHAVSPESLWAEYHHLDLAQILSDLHSRFGLRRAA